MSSSQHSAVSTQPKPVYRKGRQDRKGIKGFTAEIAEGAEEEGLLIFWMMNPFLCVLCGEFF